MLADFDGCLQETRIRTHVDLHSNSKRSHSGKLGLNTTGLTLSVDDLIDFMGVIRNLGVILYHLEAHGEVVQSAAEVGFPPGFVIGELADFTTGHSPRL